MTADRQSLGAAGEAKVARWYEAQGFDVVARNWRCRQGELDLVVRRDGLLVFCEVKTRSSAAFGSPAEAVTRTKQLRIRRLASAWLTASDHHFQDLRFDVACVLPGRLDIIENAF